MDALENSKVRVRKAHERQGIENIVEKIQYNIVHREIRNKIM